MTRTTDNQNPPERDLTSQLSREADRFFDRGGAPLDLGQVLDRAGEIRRGRRMRASMLMAACVLAVAVPTVLLASRTNVDRPITPAHHQKVDSSPLALDSLTPGKEPQGGYIQGGSLHSDGFTYTLQDQHIVAYAKVGDALMLSVRGDQGDLIARALGSGPKQTWPMSGGYAVSPEGNVAAFVRQDGTVMAVQDGGSRYFEVGDLGSGESLAVAAVTGENCSGRSEEPGCTVYVNATDDSHNIWAVSPHADPVLVKSELHKLIGVTAQAEWAGQVSSTQDGSCWAMLDKADDEQWRTCDYSLKSFSPDGRLLLAGAAYGDGAGDTQLAVLDSSNGRPVLDLRTANGAWIYDAVWEDDGHVLATVQEGGQWAVLRVALDGKREYAVAPVTEANADQSPFVLQTR